MRPLPRSLLRSLPTSVALVALLALLLLALAPSLAVAEPAVKDLQTALDGRRVLVTFHLDEAFDDATRERIQSGLPTGITYELELLRERRRWWDKSVAQATLQIDAMYNAVTREYLVNFKYDGTLIESRTVRELGELERAMTRFDRLPSFALAEEWPHEWRLRVVARAVLGGHATFLFIPVRRTTDWAESSRFRPPAAKTP